jgi:hypothetical protein
VHSPDTAAADGTRILGDLVVDVGVFEHGVGLIFELLPFQTGFKILLVSKVDFLVSFIHLECAPFDCSSNIQCPITINYDAHSRSVSPFLEKNQAGLRASPDSHARDGVTPTP